MNELHVIQIGGTPKDLEGIKALVAEIFGLEPISNEEMEGLEAALAEWAAPMRELIKMYGLTTPQGCLCGNSGAEHYMDKDSIISVFLPVSGAIDKGLLDKASFGCVVRMNADKLELFRKIAHTPEQLSEAILKLSLGTIKKLD